MKAFCENCKTIKDQSRVAPLVCKTCASPTVRVSNRQARTIHLRSLGYADYPAYLASELWATIRIRVLNRDSHECCRCGGRATQVHHRSYELNVLRGENDRQLMSVCGKCHRFAEFRCDGRKTRTSRANRRLLCESEPFAELHPSITTTDPQDFVMPRGKYKGKRISELSDKELRWAWSGFNGARSGIKMAEILKAEMERRGLQ